MTRDDHPREQTILFLICTIVASACAQLGVTLLFHEWSGPIGGIMLLSVALCALAVAVVWPRLEGRLSRELLSGFVNLVVRRRFTLAVLCIVFVAALNVWPRSWPAVRPSPTRLVLLFPKTSYGPTEKESNNVRWSYWSGLQGERGDASGDDGDEFRAVERSVYVHDVTVLFFHFDALVDCERLALTMADSSRVPDSTTYRKDERTAVLVIRGRIKRDVEMTIAPGPSVARRT